MKEIQVRHFHTWLKLSWDNIWGFSDCPYIQTAKPCMLTWVNISWPNSTVNRLSFLLSHPAKKKHCCFDTMQWIHTLKNQTKLSILLLFSTMYRYNECHAPLCQGIRKAFYHQRSTWSSLITYVCGILFLSQKIRPCLKLDLPYTVTGISPSTAYCFN